MNRKFVIAFCVSFIAFFVSIGCPLTVRAADDAAQKPDTIGKSVEQIREQAKQGDPAAQNYLGMVALFGFSGKPDYKAALDWFTKAADQGFAESIVQLGVIYENGLGVEPDLLKAAEYYQKAADLNWPIGFFHLGLLYLGGVPEGKTADEGMAMLQKSCDAGYKTGCGMKLYYDLKMEEALKIFEEQCRMGDYNACSMVNDVKSRLAQMQAAQLEPPVEAPAQKDNTIYYFLIALAVLLGAGGLLFYLWKTSPAREQEDKEPPAGQ